MYVSLWVIAGFIGLGYWGNVAAVSRRSDSDTLSTASFLQIDRKALKAAAKTEEEFEVSDSLLCKDVSGTLSLDSAVPQCWSTCGVHNCNDWRPLADPRVTHFDISPGIRKGCIDNRAKPNSRVLCVVVEGEHHAYAARMQEKKDEEEEKEKAKEKDEERVQQWKHYYDHMQYMQQQRMQQQLMQQQAKQEQMVEQDTDDNILPYVLLAIFLIVVLVVVVVVVWFVFFRSNSNSRPHRR